MIKQLKEYEELLTITKKTALFRHVQLLQEQRQSPGTYESETRGVQDL